MRPIDANTIIYKKSKFDTVYRSPDMSLCHEKRTLEWVAKEDIDEMPTIDAVPVVRCKDCKYMTEHYDTDGNAPYWICSEWDSGTDYDGYCHYGERREE